MAEPATKSAQSWEVMLEWLFIVALLVFLGKLFMEPTNDAVKRIEAMRPCAEVASK